MRTYSHSHMCETPHAMHHSQKGAACAVRHALATNAMSRTRSHPAGHPVEGGHLCVRTLHEGKTGAAASFALALTHFFSVDQPPPACDCSWSMGTGTED